MAKELNETKIKIKPAFVIQYNDRYGNGDNTSILGGAGTPVTNVGVTYYTQQVAPVMLQGMNTGR